MSFYNGAKKAKISANDLQNGFRMGNKNAEVNWNFYGIED
jgi:hypothetical protein